jgi:hypothetical protein
MQNAVYRVRTEIALTGRVALDLCPDHRAPARTVRLFPHSVTDLPRLWRWFPRNLSEGQLDKLHPADGWLRHGPSPLRRALGCAGLSARPGDFAVFSALICGLAMPQFEWVSFCR